MHRSVDPDAQAKLPSKLACRAPEKRARAVLFGFGILLRVLCESVVLTPRACSQLRGRGLYLQRSRAKVLPGCHARSALEIAEGSQNGSQRVMGIGRSEGRWVQLSMFAEHAVGHHSSDVTGAG